MNDTKLDEIDFNKQNKFLIEEMMRYVTNISWGAFKEGKFEILDNGTAFLLNLRQDTFLVTAAHVYEGFLKAKSEIENFRCVVADMEFDLEERLVGYLGSKVLDIATFKVNESEIEKLESLKKYVSYGAKDWPIEIAHEGQGIIFGGFPGAERESLGDQEYVFGLYAAISPIESSNHRTFTCHFKRENWIDTLGNGLPIKGYKLGGISGGPAFLFRISESQLISLDLAGVIYEAGVVYGEDLLTMYHSCFILPDGSLKNPKIVIPKIKE